METNNTQQEAKHAIASQFTVSYHNGLCCPHGAAYLKAKVFAVVRVSHSTRYVLADGSTLTIAPKTRYATFPRAGSRTDIVNEAMIELREKHPLTRNLWVAFNTAQ
jgi:hypothetical protein